MKKTILAIFLAIALPACTESTLDTSSENTLVASIEKISKSLTASEREELGKAVMYFSMGGPDGLEKMFAAAFNGIDPEQAATTMLASNIKTIHGMTGEQILERYRDELKKNEQASAERAEVNRLITEAEALLKDNRFEAALEKYNAVSQIPSGIQAAEAGVADATAQMQDFAEKTEYIKHIEITEFVAKRIDTFLDKNVPAVRVSLKNNGNRSLDRVTVIVFFQNEQGNTIYEKEYSPVLVSNYSLRGDTPLRPGYVKEMERDKYYTLDSNLSEWKEGEATVRVVDLVFSQ